MAGAAVGDQMRCRLQGAFRATRDHGKGLEHGSRCLKFAYGGIGGNNNKQNVTYSMQTSMTEAREP